MNTETFWKVISAYNENTIVIQIILTVIMVVGIVLSYKKVINNCAKIVLGIANLFIGIVFYLIYSTEPIQRFFALPLYLAIGIIFIYESIKNRSDVLGKPTIFQLVLIILCVLYPVISLALGNTFPHMVTYIMPCPVVSISIAVYSGYKTKNKLLLVLLTIWGLTGIKSVIFNVYEDIILLICGLYGIYLIVKEFRKTEA